MPPTTKAPKLDPWSFRGVRLSHELSLRSVARAMGISAPYLVDLELGRRRVSPKLASRFFEAVQKLSQSHR